MKNVAFITVHVGENFGSNLQAIATSETLKSIGCNPLLINYIPQRVSKIFYWKTAFKNPVRLGWRILRAPVFYKNHNIYDKFLAKFCRMSKPIYDGDDFVEKCPKADVYITGSDQVWNSHHNQGFNSRYYFDGIDGKKVAYASSFGVSKLPEQEYKEAKKLLKNYSFISVREKSGKEMVETMGYQAVQLLDPTFMLDAKGWENYSSKRIVNEPYILVYIPYNIADKDLIYKSIRRISEKKNLKVEELLVTIQKDMLEAARAHRDSHTFTATTWDEFVDTVNNKPGFIKAMWCGETECEENIKAETGATTRCMPFEQEQLSDVCVCCGKPAKKMVYFGRAY